MNYFDLFGLPQGPSVNRAILAKKYFELQKKNHPDFFTQGSDTEKDHALEQSAAINKAFNIFKDEEKTIEYFLQTVGMIEADEKYSLPPGFLMEMMEINESLTEEGAGSVIKSVGEYENILFETIRPVLENYDAAKTEEEDLLKLKEYYYKKKYLKRILDRLVD
ncbi:MAG: iron-sulfur cluster co-chaperone HscB C-terminal domain-containing protein [Ferruginibacter sp.]